MKWTINRKLLAGFSVVILILIAVVGVSYTQIHTINKSYTLLLDDRAVKAMNIKDLHIASKQVIITAREYLLVGDEQALQNYFKAKEQYQKLNGDLIEKFNGENKGSLENIHQLMNEYTKLTEHQFELKKRNDAGASLSLMSTDIRETVKNFDEEVTKLANDQMLLLDEGNNENTQIVDKTIRDIMLLGVIAILIGVGTAVIIARLISKPVISLVESATKIAGGDLTGNTIQVKTKDEIGDLASAFNLMTGNLRHLIEQVSSNTGQLSSSSEELTASSDQTTEAINKMVTSIQEVASGAEAQGQGAHESSVAMKEMAMGIQQVAGTTSTVSDLAMETSKEAHSGHQSLQKVMDQMNTIHEVVDDSASVVKNLGELLTEIVNINDFISSIANQTSLLALNAAIEAARAGEHGRGFAVVADEVKKLAEQSKVSANQITDLISRIQEGTTHAVNAMNKGTEEVEMGIEVVQEAEIGFQKILSLIDQVASQIHEVSAVSEEMSASIEEVNASIEEMASIAQISSNNTQNVASASEEQLASMVEIRSSALALSKMAEELQLLVLQFKV